jgi:hypothetical protein
MLFLFNELSIHGQFQSVDDFSFVVERIMRIRQSIKSLGSELLCNRELVDASVTPTVSMQQAVQKLPQDKRRAWMSWLTKQGPFWMDDRKHQSNEWLEVSSGTDVANKAIGEAAFCLLHGIERAVVGFDPSNWMEPTIQVTWLKECETPLIVNVPNHWSEPTVTSTLEQRDKTYDSWTTLENFARRRFQNLTITDKAFDPLFGHPFVLGAAERICALLYVLNRMCECFDENGKRTPEGNYLYDQHFAGEKAWFSTSSNTEKNEFANELTFPHPERPGEYLLCAWHGKVKSPQLRIHFSWPISVDNPLYVVYIGPKITKR